MYRIITAIITAAVFLYVLVRGPAWMRAWLLTLAAAIVVVGGAALLLAATT